MKRLRKLIHVLPSVSNTSGRKGDAIFERSPHRSKFEEGRALTINPVCQINARRKRMRLFPRYPLTSSLRILPWSTGMLQQLAADTTNALAVDSAVD